MKWLALLILAAGVSAQQVPSQEFNDTVSVGYVMVPFTVFGSKGDPVTNLRQKEITLLVDGQPVKSDMFERSMDAPVSFTILLDGSGSMALAGKMEAARAAIGALIAHRKPGDDFALYVFDDKGAHEVVPFTSDVGAIGRGLVGLKPFGKTAFFDALATIPERSRLGRNPTRAIILLSDGIDNASHLTREQLAQRLEGVAIPIYALGLREPGEQTGAQAPRLSGQAKAPVPQPISEEMSDLDVLEEVASLTGGKLFVGNHPDQLSTAIAAVEQNLRAQYLIGFSPTGKGAVKYRRISLKVEGRARSVRVRAGYRGTEPPVLSATRRS
jgi:Ca-activated chloride channel family protein